MSKPALSPLASMILSCVGPEMRAAYVAGIVGRNTYEAAVQSAAYTLILGQDESIDIRRYLKKVEAAVEELASTK